MKPGDRVVVQKGSSIKHSRYASHDRIAGANFGITIYDIRDGKVRWKDRELYYFETRIECVRPKEKRKKNGR